MEAAAFGQIRCGLGKMLVQPLAVPNQRERSNATVDSILNRGLFKGLQRELKEAIGTGEPNQTRLEPPADSLAGSSRPACWPLQIRSPKGCS